jgi:hypothetical protein
MLARKSFPRAAMSSIQASRFVWVMRSIAIFFG